MEEFKRFVVQNWSVIIEYMIMAVAYFLFFLYRSKVRTTKRDLTVMFKEKAQEVTDTDIALRESVSQTEQVMANELVEAKAQYQAAIDGIADLVARLNRAEKALIEIITETEVVDDGEQGTNEEN